MRRTEEFYCTECGKYFKTFLRASMWGNYTIECPNCNHHHFRVIKDGLITQDRHDKSLGGTEVILCLKSTISNVPYHDNPEFRRQQMRAYK